MQPIIFINAYIKNIFKLKHFKDQNFEEINKNILKEFKNLGYSRYSSNLKLKNISKNLKKKIDFLNSINRYFPNSKLFFNKNYYNYSNEKFLKWKIFFPEINSIVEENLSLFTREILGKKYEIISAIWQKNQNIPEHDKNEYFSNYWHFDFRRDKKKWLRLMIYLTDQGKEESLHWFNFANSQRAIQNEDYGRFSDNKLPEYLKNKHNTSEGSLGTIGIVNTADILHKAGLPPQNKPREVIFVILKSKDLEWEDNLNFIDSPIKN